MPQILKNTSEISDVCNETNESTFKKLEMYQNIGIISELMDDNTSHSKSL